MSAVSGFLSALFWGLLVLSLLVCIHEAGHFAVARAFGVRVTEFFLGFPCRYRLSFKSRRYGTEFGVTPILLGGYNRICGMEGEEVPELADALAYVQERGTVYADDLGEALGVGTEGAYRLLETLVDWGSIKPYYDVELGEYEGQGSWPEAFMTIARDADGLTEYDRGHDLSTPGSTADGEPRVLAGTPQEALSRERSHTYLGCGFWQRFAILMAGPIVNLVAAIVIIVVTLSVFGMDVYDEAGVVHWRPDLWFSLRFAFEFAGTVARFAVDLITPARTMQVIENSSSVVGISVMASEAASAGPIDLALLIAPVSMSLGFMNLLPILPLDGGKIVLEAFQALTRREVSRKVQLYISYAGLAFFLFIFVFALKNDIVRYVIR